MLEANIDGTTVGGVQIATLNTEENREIAYAALVAEGLAEPAPTEADIDAALQTFVIYDTYREDSAAVTDAATRRAERHRRPRGLVRDH